MTLEPRGFLLKMVSKKAANKEVTRDRNVDGITTLLKAIEVTGLAKSRDRSSSTFFVVVAIDGKEMWRSNVIDNDINPKWTMSDPIKLVIRPSSDLKIDVFRKSRIKFKSPHNLGNVSDEAIRLANNENLIPLSNQNGSISIKICLTIDSSRGLSIDDLGMEKASQALDRAQASLARTGDDSRVFTTVSQQIGQDIQTAQSTVTAAQSLSGVQLIGDALKCLDVVVKFVDSVADAHPMFKVAWTVLSYVYKALKHQVELDQAIWELSAGLQKMLSYAKACCELKEINGMPNVIEEVGRLVVEGALLIDRCMKSGFIGRATKSVFDDVGDQISCCQKKLDTLRGDLSITLAIDTNQGIKDLISAKDEKLLKQLKPKGMSIPPECMDGTRGDILAIVNGWAENVDAPNVLWVSGAPGVGKSAIASTMVMDLRTSHCLGSSFFFMRDKPNLATPIALWRNVAYDLARLYPSVLKVILGKLNDEVVGTDTTSVKMLFRHLIEEPLKSNMEIATDTPVVIVVDALDECGGLDGHRSSHRERLLDTIKDWSRLPSRFKLVITSRREDDISRTMLSVPHHPVPLLSGLSVQDQSSNDIRLFLKARFAHISKGYPDSLECTWPGSTVIDQLTTQAAGLFVWAKTVADFVNRGEPKEQLQQIQDGDIGNGDMTRLYSRILDIYFKRPSQGVLNSFRTIAGAIILAKTPLRRGDYLALLPVDASMFDFIHKGLQSVMIVGDTLRFNHQSVVDFLTDSNNCPKAFFVDLAVQSRVLTLECLRVMDDLRFNMCELESSYYPNAAVLDLPGRVEKAISAHLAYSCCYWADHLQATSFSAETRVKVDRFMRTRFLYWLEALSLLNVLNVGVRALRSIVVWCGTHVDDTVAFVKDGIKFVTAFGSVISQSVPHIYLSALPFTPVTSEVSKTFLAQFPQTLSIETGKAMGWPAIQSVLEGHSWTVTSVAFSPDGKRIVSGSGDHTVCVWDAETQGIITGPFMGHSGRVNSVAFSPDNKRIVSGSDDKTIRVWDAETGGVVSGPFEGHSDDVNCVAYSPDGRRVVSGSNDRTILVWDAETGHIVSEPFKGHYDHVNCVSFPPDGRRIVSGSKDGTIRVWDVETGDVVTGPFGAPFGGSYTSVSFSPDGTRIASGSWDKMVRVWDAETGDAVAGPFEGHSNWVNSVAFLPDGTRIVSGSSDNTILVWDAETGDVILGPFGDHSNWVTSVAFSPDGTRIVSGSLDRTIRIWDAETGGVVSGSFEGHTKSVNSVAFSPDGARIVSGSTDKTIWVWNGETGEVVSGPFKGHSDSVLSVAFSPDGRRIASGSGDTTIRVWDAETGKVVSGPFPGHSDRVTSVAFSPDGERIVSGSDDETVRVWDAETGDAVAGPFQGHFSWVTSVGFSPDGTRIVSGSCDFTIRVWDAKTGEVVFGPFYENFWTFNSVIFSPDGTRILSGSNGGTIQVRDAESGEVVLGPLQGHSDGVSSVAFSPDGTRIVSGSYDRTIQVWNAETGQVVLGPLRGHTDAIRSVAFSPNGTRIVSGSLDGTVRVWHTGDVEVSGPFKLHDRGMDNGWILGEHAELLLWVPPWNRLGLWWPRNMVIIGEAPTRLGFRQFAHDTSWQQCISGL